ncbi:PQQ-binding-like beta-propeller repeat protein [Streptomyces sp. NPDC050610]|uniref:outer membrane protein assembly factor BamB family protein n=1 Tax=Streptomyces sp. NPDC050610 TaxID=3157097 RepID=UPI0034185B4D
MTQPPPEQPFDQRPTAPPGFGPPPLSPFTASALKAVPDQARRGRRRTILTLVLALLLAAGLGTGGWLLWSGEPAAEPSPQHRVDARLEWLTPVPDADKDSMDATATTWFAKGNVIQTTARAVTAYREDGGKPSWSVPVPGVACGSSPRPDGGIAAIAYGKQKYHCDQLMAVDLRHGRSLWHKNLADSRGDDQLYQNANISVSRGVVTLSGNTRTVAFTADKGSPVKRRDNGCVPRGDVASGGQDLSLVQCDLSGRQFLMRVDPKTGIEKWTWKVLDGVTVHNILSVDPAVVTIGREGESDVSNIALLDDQGHLKKMISLTSGPYALGCNHMKLDSCRLALVAGGSIYLATGNDDGVRADTIAAFDAATGERRWSVRLPGQRENRPLALHDGRLLVYQEATQDESGRVFSLDPSTGGSKLHLKLPTQSAEAEKKIAHNGFAYFRDDHLYLVAGDGASGNSLLMSYR